MSQLTNLAFLRVRPGNDLVPGAHTDAHIVLPLWGPGMDVVVGSQRIELGGATGIAVSPLTVHSSSRRDPIDDASMLAFYINQDWLSQHCSLSMSVPFQSVSVPVNDILNDTARTLARKIESGSTNLVAETTVFLEKLIALACDPRGRDRRPADWARLDPRVRRAMCFMQRHLDARVSLEQVARSVGLSRPHFFSLFHQQTSLTPRIYWNLLRAENAVSCIQVTESPISDLAYNLGFSSPGNFSRFFREHIGVSPICFRKGVRQIIEKLQSSGTFITASDRAPRLRIGPDGRGRRIQPAVSVVRGSAHGEVLPSHD
jgi:AraC family transcriptional regulator